MDHRDIVIGAGDAIDRIYFDQSVSHSSRIGSLKALRFVIETWIERLEIARDSGEGASLSALIEPSAIVAWRVNSQTGERRPLEGPGDALMADHYLE